MNIKKITSLLTASAISVSLAVPVTADDETARVTVNGTELVCDVPPVIMNDRTLVPLRAICEALGYDVCWNEEESAISIFDGSLLYMMWLDKNVAFTTSPFIEEAVVMDVPPTTLNDRTLIPLRALSQLIPGASIEWDGDTFTAAVTTDKDAPEIEPGTAERYAGYTSAYTRSYDRYAALYTGTAKIINADIVLGDGSKIVLELYPEIAPETVANFVRLANSESFNGKIFHRVINNFVIQGGSFTPDGVQYTSEPIAGEFMFNKFPNFLKHTRGTISMARLQNDPDSASNQFFITHADAYPLDGQYATFGKVISGMDVVDSVAAVPTDDNDRPVDDIVIASVNINTDMDLSEMLATPVVLTEVKPPESTVSALAESLGMTYAELILACGIDASQVRQDMQIEDFKKLLTISAYLKVFENNSVTYSQFLEMNGIPATKVTPETTLAELDKIMGV